MLDFEIERGIEAYVNLATARMQHPADETVGSMYLETIAELERLLNIRRALGSPKRR